MTKRRSTAFSSKTTGRRRSANDLRAGAGVYAPAYPGRTGRAGRTDGSPVPQGLLQLPGADHGERKKKGEITVSREEFLAMFYLLDDQGQEEITALIERLEAAQSSRAS